MHPCLITGLTILLMVIQNQVFCDSSSGGDTSDSVPLLASDKRQHNIMRFGKRPAKSHGLVHFGKRENDVSDIWDYLQRNGDMSYKRGHTIMRFGKRAPESHNFIRFGRTPGDDESEDSEKRATGHSMMYFGKRGATNGHSMMYFGKRGAASGHSMLYFGKREDPFVEDYNDIFGGKRAHAMIHFGKRDENGPKGRSHSMIHFGKRDPDDDQVLDGVYLDPEIEEIKRQHNLLRFGKRLDRKGSHSMIHFGKRDIDEEKRAHAMIHFGKRSVADGEDKNQSNEAPSSRMKREAEQSPGPLVTLVNYDDQEENVPLGDDARAAYRSIPSDFWPQSLEEPWDSRTAEYFPEKKDGSKNVFLRFG